MKKTLLLTLILTVVLVCVFAISVGAVTGSTSDEYGTVTYVDGISEVKGYDTTSRAVVKNTDGTYTTYPAYYIYNGSTGTNMRVDFTKLSNATGESYTKASLIRVEVFADAKLNWTFQDCTSLIEAYLPEGAYLHYASFTGCSSLTTINIPSTATQIPTECFNACTSLSSITIPTTVKTLGAKAFQDCFSLSEIKFPENYTGIIPQDFRKITNWSAERVKVTYIIPKGCTGVNSKYSLDNCEVGALIFTGDQNSTFISDLTTDASGWVSKVTYANHCEYYFDNNHSAEFGYVFTSFVKECYTEGVCSRCGEKSKGETFAPIFKFLGYSSNGENMCAGYMISVPSINKYNEVNASSPLKYGFVASANNTAPIDANGNFASNTVSVDLSKENYVAFDFILTGDFTNPSSANAKISMNLYTITKDADGASVVNYIYGYNVENNVVSEVYNIADSVSFNDLNPTEA